MEAIEQVKAKYNYNDKLIELLQIIIPNIIEYFGDDNTSKIINSFLNTEIKVVEDNHEGKEFLNSIGIFEEYFSSFVPSVKYCEKFFLNSNNRIERIAYLLIKEINLDYSTLYDVVQQLCHMIMNYDKVIHNDNHIISKTGLIEEKIEIVNGKIIKSLPTNVFFEDSLNNYDTLKILELITNKKIVVLNL